MRWDFATCVATISGAILASPTAALSQAYPSKPIRLIVPIVPGGSVDLIARQFAKRMTESMGQPLVVENISGASGTIGTAQVVRAAPDGYTFMWSTVGETIVYRFMSKIQPYDSVKDLTPLMAAVSGITLLAAHPSTPGNNLREVVDYARANPGKLAYASAGIGSYFHMTGEMFKSAANLDILHVPYKGVPPALNGLAGGQVQMMFVSVASSQPFVGRIKILGVNEPKRYAGLPDLPAVGEVVSRFEKLPTWYAFFGPAGMQRPIVTRLNAEMNKALVAADMRQYLDSIGFVSLGGTPEDLATSLQKGIAIYGEAVKLANLKPE
ncbi:MAG: tripartite tricarboxylate transporter substrate binding protein [Betaproteobacteria bacterium]|nr:tripartite tricarboxylate transporter substrate binding protein [Betaproteobacteria bacterium]